MGLPYIQACSEHMDTEHTAVFGHIFLTLRISGCRNCITKRRVFSFYADNLNANFYHKNEQARFHENGEKETSIVTGFHVFIDYKNQQFIKNSFLWVWEGHVSMFCNCFTQKHSDNSM